MDSAIRIFDQDGKLQSQLSGHKKGVISFSWIPGHPTRLISGSWDGQAILWDIESERMLMRFGPHENGVHVLAISEQTLITTSTGEAVDGKPANYQIRFWDMLTGNQSAPPVCDHAGSIRSIAALPGVAGFLTTSNDGSVIMRGVDGQPIEQLFHSSTEDGSPPFVLDCCALITELGMDFISCGEDGSFNIWSGGELVQSIPHPSTVWTAAALPSGYPIGEGGFLTGCHDGSLRLFAKTSTELANNSFIAQLNSNFVEEVQDKQRARSQGPSVEEIAKAVRWEERGRHLTGRKENDVMVFNRDGTLIAAQFNSGSWVEIGEVTGKGDGGYIDNVWFDHVMPVEIETSTGLQNLQLGYNNGENPFVSAQRFVDTHGLPQVYLSQIADWIQQRAGKSSAPTLGGDSSSVSPTRNSSTASAAPLAPPVIVTCVIDGYVVYDELPNQAKLFTKLQELNSEAAGSGIPALDSNSLKMVETAIKTLWETSRYHSSEISSAEILALFRLSNVFSLEKRFIAYDLLRLLVLHPQSAQSLATTPAVVISTLTSCVELLTSLVASGGSSATGIPLGSLQNTLLTMSKFVTNLWRSDTLRRSLISSSPVIVSQVTFAFAVLLSQSSLYAPCNKSVRLALVSVPYNFLAFSYIFKTTDIAAATITPEVVDKLVLGSLQVFHIETDAETTVYRAAQCLQTLLKYNLLDTKRALISTAWAAVGTHAGSFIAQQVLPRWTTGSVRTALQEIAAELNK
jgi:phospholipase A-2-activating protein